MSSGIYLIQDDNQLIQMKPVPYESESLLQELLANYPDLLAGDQINEVSPRRWLLISREMSVPSEEGGIGRWSLDHLFLDQDGIPTFVEVKRSCDTRIRREVVGQMLDYAANGVVYWSSENIRTKFIANCQVQQSNSEDVLFNFLEDMLSPEDFWKKVETNLQLGKVRMIFVADLIPPELQRIVEFLNTQMSSAEVLAVEIKQYTGQGLKTLVPRVIGQTVETKQKKANDVADPIQWNVDSFFSALEKQKGSQQTHIARKILAWANDNDNCQIRWGKGFQYGCFKVKRIFNGKEYSLFRVWTNGMIDGFPTNQRFRLDSSWLALTKAITDQLAEDNFSGHFSAGTSIPLLAFSDEPLLLKFFEVMISVTQDDGVLQNQD